MKKPFNQEIMCLRCGELDNRFYELKDTCKPFFAGEKRERVILCEECGLLFEKWARNKRKNWKVWRKDVEKFNKAVFDKNKEK